MSRINIREYYKKDVKELSAVEFEECCLAVLRGYAEEKHLDSFMISHNEILKSHDGDYQVDVYSEFTIFGGSKIKVLIECKQYNSPVKRERVELLYSRLQSTGSHKGILMTTAQFQSGAIRFAEEHGITLIEVMNTCDRFHSYASGPSFHENLSLEDEILYRSPVFTANVVVGGRQQVYPTTAMINSYIEEIQREKGQNYNRSV